MLFTFVQGMEYFFNTCGAITVILCRRKFEHVPELSGKNPTKTRNIKLNNIASYYQGGQETARGPFQYRGYILIAL